MTLKNIFVLLVFLNAVFSASLENFSNPEEFEESSVYHAEALQYRDFDEYTGFVKRNLSDFEARYAELSALDFFKNHNNVSNLLDGIKDNADLPDFIPEEEVKLYAGYGDIKYGQFVRDTTLQYDQLRQTLLFKWWQGFIRIQADGKDSVQDLLAKSHSFYLYKGLSEQEKREFFGVYYAADTVGENVVNLYNAMVLTLAKDKNALKRNIPYWNASDSPEDANLQNLGLIILEQLRCNDVPDDEKTIYLSAFETVMDYLNDDFLQSAAEFYAAEEEIALGWENAKTQQHNRRLVSQSRPNIGIFSQLSLERKEVLIPDPERLQRLTVISGKYFANPIYQQRFYAPYLLLERYYPHGLDQLPAEQVLQQKNAAKVNLQYIMGRLSSNDLQRRLGIYVHPLSELKKIYALNKLMEKDIFLLNAKMYSEFVEYMISQYKDAIWDEKSMEFNTPPALKPVDRFSTEMLAPPSLEHYQPKIDDESFSYETFKDDFSITQKQDEILACLKEKLSASQWIEHSNVDLTHQAIKAAKVEFEKLKPEYQQRLSDISHIHEILKFADNQVLSIRSAARLGYLIDSNIVITQLNSLIQENSSRMHRDTYLLYRAQDWQEIQKAKENFLLIRQAYEEACTEDQTLGYTLQQVDTLIFGWQQKSQSFESDRQWTNEVRLNLSLAWYQYDQLAVCVPEHAKLWQGTANFFKALTVPPKESWLSSQERMEKIGYILYTGKEIPQHREYVMAYEKLIGLLNDRVLQLALPVTLDALEKALNPLESLIRNHNAP